METKFKHNGFSLTEVLMAVGILSIAMMMIAAMFPVAIYLTSVASERTMAAIVADGAFAKIQLYGVDPCSDPCVDYENQLVSSGRIDPNEFSYPPVDPCTNTRQYYWSALYKFDPNSSGYLVTVFVARKTNPGLTYWSFNRPRIVDVNVQNVPGEPNDRLKISEPNKAKYINPPTTIFDTRTGQLYRVTEKIGIGNIDANIVTLDRNWDANDSPRRVWFIPPPSTGGRNAGIEVYQRIMKF